MEKISRNGKFWYPPFYNKGEINMYNNYYQPATAPAANYSPAIRPTTGLKGRPVSSLEEARASSIDFDGTVFYFPDLANKRIYTKQINLDGSATLLMYELQEIPVETQPTYITREEFENTIAQLKNLLATAP
jgi:hypothetical protein